MQYKDLTSKVSDNFNIISFSFYILLTVHLGTIGVNNLLDALL
jgi:hypothetical protein